MIRWLPVLLILTVATGLAETSARTEDLGRGLCYWRVENLPRDIPTTGALVSFNALVIDLRGTTCNLEGTEALSAWIRFQARPNHPVFILIDKSTGVHALGMIPALSDSGQAIVTLGPATLGAMVDVAVNTSDTMNRKACEAIAGGAPLKELASPKIAKVRKDEAELARDYKEGIRSDDDSPDPDLTQPSKEPALMDLVLARAVQLHRALLALHRIQTK